MELRIGLIGTGSIGRTHIERINERLRRGRVVACSDVNVDFGRAAAAQYGCRFYESGEALIAADEIDAVIITTIDEYHKQYALAAIRAGKYVFCEKPLAPTPEECREVLEAEMAGGRRLVQVGFMRRYDPGYRLLREAIHSGRYGAPLLLHCAHRAPTVADYWTTPMTLTNCMIHEIDIVRWLLGEDYATVQVSYGGQTANADPVLLRDPQVMVLTTTSGVRIDVEAFVHAGFAYDIRCEVVCDHAAVRLPDPPLLVTRFDGMDAHGLYTDWFGRFIEAYDVEFQEWIDAALAGRVDGPTTWDGYLAQITAGAAATARDTQTIVRIAQHERPPFYD